MSNTLFQMETIIVRFLFIKMKNGLPHYLEVEISRKEMLKREGVMKLAMMIKVEFADITCL